MIYQCRQYSKQFQEEMEYDPVLRNLIMTQRLFKSTQLISCPEYIRYQYYLYSRLLHRYLEQKYHSTEKAIEKQTKFDELFNEILPPIKAMLEEIFIETDSRQLALLLNEVYDLNRQPASLTVPYWPHLLAIKECF